MGIDTHTTTASLSPHCCLLLLFVDVMEDFVDCAEHLVAQRVTLPERLAVCGRSAGGLLVGNVVNMRPDLFAAAVADVPFVDLMNTVRDSRLGS